MLMHLVLLQITINTHLKAHGRISSSEMVGIMVGQLSKYLVQRGPFTFYLCISSVQFSCSVMSNSLRPHEPQHTRPPCPSPTPGVHPNPCLLSQRCHPTISSSVVPFSCLNISQHQGLFQWVSSSHQMAKVLELQLQHQSWLDLLVVQGTLKSLLQHHSSKASIFGISLDHSPNLTSIHDHWKNHSLD